MSIEPDFREQTEKERELIARLLEPDFPGKETLARQMSPSRVRHIDLEGSLEFEFPLVESPAPVVKRVPIEAEGADDDGIGIHVLLHVVDGIAKEVEIYKDDGSPIERMPEPRELHLVVLGPDRQLPSYRSP
jgi:hypothetical protein